jgi:carbamoyl-phosphate synthase large subunit
VPFVSKAIGRPLAKIAARAMAGQSLASQGFTREIVPRYTSVKESVFPFVKFQGADSVLGPEMKSTGEVMGVDVDFPCAFAKAQAAAFNALPTRGRVLVSLADEDKQGAVELARPLVELGFTVLATAGTALVLEAAGVACARIAKEYEPAPNTITALSERSIHLVFTTVRHKQGIRRSQGLRRAALRNGVPYFTTLAGARAAVAALVRLAGTGPLEVRSLQALHGAPSP